MVHKSHLPLCFLSSHFALLFFIKEDSEELRQRRAPWTCPLNNARCRKTWLWFPDNIDYSLCYIGYIQTWMSVNVLMISPLLSWLSSLIEYRISWNQCTPRWRGRLNLVLCFTNSGVLCHPITSEFPALCTATLHPASSIFSLLHRRCDHYIIAVKSPLE